MFVCLYVCMFVCLYVCMLYVCMFVCLYVCVFVCACACACVCVQVYVCMHGFLCNSALSSKPCSLSCGGAWGSSGLGKLAARGCGNLPEPQTTTALETLSKNLFCGKPC